MAWNIRIVSTYPPRRCGIGTFSKDLANALSHFTGEVGHIRIAAIDNGNGPYNIPVDLSQVPAGFYIAELVSGDFSWTEKLVRQ